MPLLRLPPALEHDLQQVAASVSERLRSRGGIIGAAGWQGDNDYLRSALVLLTAQLGSYSLEQVIHPASAVELIYAATNTHSDLVEGAARRRGNAMLQAPWDQGVPLMVGDYLFSLAAGEMALSPDPRVITYFSQAVLRICEGELLPVMVASPLEQAEEQYIYRAGCISVLRGLHSGELFGLIFPA